MELTWRPASRGSRSAFFLFGSSSSQCVFVAGGGDRRERDDGDAGERGQAQQRARCRQEEQRAATPSLCQAKQGPR